MIKAVLRDGCSSYGAFAPDVPGCVAADDTRGATQALMYEALQEHLNWMLEDGDPKNNLSAVYMAVTVGEEAKLAA